MDALIAGDVPPSFDAMLAEVQALIDRLPPDLRERLRAEQMLPGPEHEQMGTR